MTGVPAIVRVALGGAFVLLVGVSACSGDDRQPPSAAPEETTSSTATAPTTVPDFSGDPDSEFCELVRGAGDRPVLDPFEAGLEPREVELRFRNLQSRFAEFADASPPELEPILDELLVALEQLGTILDDHDYDFAQVAESGADTSVFDDPAFTDAAARISAYETQVCSG